MIDTENPIVLQVIKSCNIQNLKTKLHIVRMVDKLVKYGQSFTIEKSLGKTKTLVIDYNTRSKNLRITVKENESDSTEGIQRNAN